MPNGRSSKFSLHSVIKESEQQHFAATVANISASRGIDVMILSLFLPCRAPLHLRLRHRPLHLLLPEGERGGARLRQDGLFPSGEGLQERHRRAISPGGHLDDVHEGEAQLLALRGDPLLLQRAAEHLLPARAGPHLRHLHDQCVSDP